MFARGLALALVLTLSTLRGESTPVLPAPERNADLLAGITLVKEGDFEGAVVRLDGALRRLAAAGGTSDLAQAYLYLGVAYLELDQEALARGKFAQALARQPEMRLDPGEFSRQVIRTFESTRQETLPVETNDRTAAASVPPRIDGPGEEAPKEGRSAVPLLILGGAAAAGGVALASGAGGTNPTPSPTPVPTPTPAPLPCTFAAQPERRQEFPASGGTGFCDILTRSDCGWDAVSTAAWLQITAGRSGLGNGRVSFTVLPNNTGKNRDAEIHLVQDSNTSCEVRQEDEENSGPGLLPALASWASELTVPGGSGRVVVDGAVPSLHGPGRSEGARALTPGTHRIDGLLTSSRGRPGVWRFRLAGAFRTGTLHVLAGEAASVSADAVVFRLRGLPGERIAFMVRVGN